MKLTERQKMMAVSAHCGNQLRVFWECFNSFSDLEFEPRDRICLTCVTDRYRSEYDEVYNPGWPIGKLVRWLDSL